MSCTFERKAVKAERFSMEYCVFGTGARPLVVLPGMSVQSVMNALEGFAAAYSCFSATHTVYLFDRTQPMPEGYRVCDMAQDTVYAMRQLGLADADVFGASQGGMIAQCIAAQAPELVHTLALGSTMARPNAVSNATFDRWTVLAKAGNARALNRDITKTIYCEQTRLAFQAVFAATQDCGTAEELRRFAVLSQASRHFDFYDRLDRIQCPVLVLGASDDRVLWGGASLELARRLQCPCHLYGRFGHAVYDEAPDYRARLMHFFCEHTPEEKE